MGAIRADEAMERYAVGDDSAFALVYDELAAPLHAFLSRRVSDQALAEDLLQQTFLHIIKSRGSFLSGARVAPWAFAIARRLLVDELRRCYREQHKRAEAPEPAATSTPEVLLDVHQTADELARELDRLPEKQRDAFELVRLGGLSLREVAELLCISESAVKSLVHRASEAMRELITVRQGDAA